MAHRAWSAARAAGLGGILWFTHRTNKGQRAMGIITLAFIVEGPVSTVPFHVPTWVIVVSAAARAMARAPVADIAGRTSRLRVIGRHR